MKKSIILTMVFAFFSTILLQSANAEDMTIDMLNKRDDGAKMVYSIDVGNSFMNIFVHWV